MGKGDDTGDQGSPNCESEEPQEEEILDEAYVAEVFERYRPVPFG